MAGDCAAGGVALASVLFVSDTDALIAISDRVLKGLIGAIGILFVAFQMARRWVLGRLTEAEGMRRPGKGRSAVLGVAAGVLSTISHLAGPAAVIYFVPQQLGKLMLALWMAPVIQIGVGIGYWLVSILQEKHYVGLIYGALVITSGMLVYRVFAGWQGPHLSRVLLNLTS